MIIGGGTSLSRAAVGQGSLPGLARPVRANYPQIAADVVAVPGKCLRGYEPPTAVRLASRRSNSARSTSLAVASMARR